MLSPLRIKAFLFIYALVVLIAGTGASRAAEAPTYDRIRFSVSTEQQIQADQVVAVLAAQRQGAKAAELAREVNGLITWGLDQAKSVPEVQAQTLAYETTPVYAKGSLSGWRVAQSIKLEATDATALSELVGRLQDRLLLQSVDYALSADRRKTVEAELIRSSLDAFKDRARLIAERMGQPHYRIVEAQVDTDGHTPPPLYRSAPVALAAAEAGAPVPPSIGAGMQMLRVRVSGVIELQPQ
ncbi:MAG: SIMPL domain-containing protein [Chromatiaceae bacterium]